MRSTLKEMDGNEYPKLKINKTKTIIVLFTEFKKGVVVSSLIDEHEIGSTHQKWDESHFRIYKGTVTLEN